MSAKSKAEHAGGPPDSTAVPAVAGPRQVFDDRLQTEWQRAERAQLPLSLLLIEMDHFPAYTARLGPTGADTCLNQIAAQLAHAVFRPTDLVARYGEAQFAIVLPTHEAGARVVAARVRHAVNGLALPHRGGEGGIVTVSIGVAALTPAPGMSPAELVTLAEGALTQARRIGRDCIVSQDWIAE